MHRLSTKQNVLLDQLREQGKRIEKLSKIEHDLIKEVHPQVSEIKEGMETMIAVVKENTQPPVARKKAHLAHLNLDFSKPPASIGTILVIGYYHVAARNGNASNG